MAEQTLMPEAGSDLLDRLVDTFVFSVGVCAASFPGARVLDC